MHMYTPTTLLICGVLLACYGELAAADDSKAASSTHIVLLGTGNPAPIPERSGPCTAIVVNGTPYLVDLGPGAVRQAMAAYKKGISGLHFSKLKRAFITHLHSDHTVGYPDFIFTPWVVGREGPLEVHGPKGIKKMTTRILEAWSEDIEIRSKGMERKIPEHNDTGYKVNAHEIRPGIVYRDTNVTVKAFRVPHGDWEHAFGFRFETPDRTIVISGDTSPSEELVKHAIGCDVLIHEVYTQKGFAKATPDWQALRLKYHTSTRQMAEIARRVQPKLLILYHQSYHFTNSTEEDLLKEMQENYSGKFVSGHDLDVY